MIENDAKQLSFDSSPANLLSELARRGLHFFVDDHVEQEPRPLPSEELIAGLARHEDARLHLALIALFLYEPGVETAVFTPPTHATLTDN